MRESTLPNKMSGAGSSERSGLSLTTPVMAVAKLLLAILREIFDESAYSRFLLRHEMNSSPKTYAAFLLEQQRLKARRLKCC
jgi:hypothetical protein